MGMINRENRIWKPFMYAMPGMTTAQEQERALIFGLYAGAYLNNEEYLQAYKDAELEMIVDNYNQKMAELDAEEQKAVLEIVTRRYLAQIDVAVHDVKMDGMHQQVTDDDAMMDARFEALEADYKSLETLAARLARQEKEIAARIAVLQAQIAGEDINRQMVDVDISRAELDVARKETELAGKDTQIAYKDIEAARLDIAIAQKETQALEQDMQIDEKDLQIARAELEQAEKDLQITYAGHEILRTQMQIVEAGLKEVEHERDMARIEIEQANTEEKILQTDRVRLELSEAELSRKRAEQSVREADLKAVGIDSDIAKTQAQIATTELDRFKTDRDVANIGVQIIRAQEQMAQTGFMQADLEMAEIQRDVVEKGLEIYEHRIAVAEARQETISEEIEHVAAVQSIEDAIGQLRQDEKNVHLQQRLSSMDIHTTTALLRLAYRQIRMDAEHEIADTEDTYQPRMDDATLDAYRARRLAARTSTDAAIDAAQTLAGANIMTTMTHSIGRAD